MCNLVTVNLMLGQPGNGQSYHPTGVQILLVASCTETEDILGSGIVDHLQTALQTLPYFP